MSLGSWTAANGKYTVKTVHRRRRERAAVKQANNTSDHHAVRRPGREHALRQLRGGSRHGRRLGATVVGPNRTIGDLAGEASGRKAVDLNSTGDYVQWTSRESTNTFVVRYAIPDASGGGGINATLDLYVNGTLVKPLSLTSHYAWLYGAETGPGNSPSAGARGTSTTRPASCCPRRTRPAA